jgi:putative hydroxymethylpyrimidine transport system permease protein
MNAIASRLIVIAAFCLIWQSIILIFSFPPYILPSPWIVLFTLDHQFSLILQHTFPTLYEAFMGFILGSLLGVASAIALHFIGALRKFLLPFLITSQALPAFALAPLLVIWFGYGASSKIATCILVLFFPVTSAFYDGLQRTPTDYLDLAKTMNASKWRTLRYIQIPFALPYLASGLRLAAVFAPMGALIGEWVGSSEGLGFLLLNANAQMKIDLLFAVLIVVVLLTLTFYFIVDRLLKRWVYWSEGEK